MNPQTLGILQPFSKNFSVYYGLVIVLGPRKSKWKEYTMMALHVGPGVRLAGFEAFCNNYLGDLGSFFFFLVPSSIKWDIKFVELLEE